ncbi:hypothetical protein ABH899_005716 [Paenibacillus sp. RC84]
MPKKRTYILKRSDNNGFIFKTWKDLAVYN